MILINPWLLRIIGIMQTALLMTSSRRLIMLPHFVLQSAKAKVSCLSARNLHSLNWPETPVTHLCHVLFEVYWHLNCLCVIGESFWIVRPFVKKTNKVVKAAALWKDMLTWWNTSNLNFSLNYLQQEGFLTLTLVLWKPLPMALRRCAPPVRSAGALPVRMTERKSANRRK